MTLEGEYYLELIFILFWYTVAILMTLEGEYYVVGEFVGTTFDKSQSS